MSTPEDTYSLGSVNVDSLKELIATLATTHVFLDENSKAAFYDQLNGIHKAGNPHEQATEAAPVDQSELDALRAKVAELESAAANPTPPTAA